MQAGEGVSLQMESQTLVKCEWHDCKKTHQKNLFTQKGELSLEITVTLKIGLTRSLNLGNYMEQVKIQEQHYLIFAKKLLKQYPQ